MLARDWSPRPHAPRTRVTRSQAFYLKHVKRWVDLVLPGHDTPDAASSRERRAGEHEVGGQGADPVGGGVVDRERGPIDGRRQGRASGAGSGDAPSPLGEDEAWRYCCDRRPGFPSTFAVYQHFRSRGCELAAPEPPVPFTSPSASGLAFPRLSGRCCRVTCPSHGRLGAVSGGGGLLACNPIGAHPWSWGVLRRMCCIICIPKPEVRGSRPTDRGFCTLGMRPRDVSHVCRQGTPPLPPPPARAPLPTLHDHY